MRDHAAQSVETPAYRLAQYLAALQRRSRARAAGFIDEHFDLAVERNRRRLVEVTRATRAALRVPLVAQAPRRACGSSGRPRFRPARRTSTASRDDGSDGAAGHQPARAHAGGGR